MWIYTLLEKKKCGGRVSVWDFVIICGNKKKRKERGKWGCSLFRVPCTSTLGDCWLWCSVEILMSCAIFKVSVWLGMKDHIRKCSVMLLFQSIFELTLNYATKKSINQWLTRRNSYKRISTNTSALYTGTDPWHGIFLIKRVYTVYKHVWICNGYSVFARSFHLNITTR